MKKYLFFLFDHVHSLWTISFFVCSFVLAGFQVANAQDRKQELIDYNIKQLGQLKELNGNTASMYMFYVQRLTNYGEVAVPALLVALKDSSHSARSGSATALQNIAASHPEQGVGFSATQLPLVIEGLQTAVKDDIWYVRSHAEGALSNIANLDSSSRRQIVLILIGVLDDPMADVRQSVANDLGQLGPKVPTLILPALYAHLHDSNPYVRERVLVGFSKSWRISQDTALKVFISALADSSSNVRSTAARILGYLGSFASPAIQTLEALQSDPDKTVRSEVKKSLKQIKQE